MRRREGAKDGLPFLSQGPHRFGIMSDENRFYGEELDILLPLIAALDYEVVSASKVRVSSLAMSGIELVPLTRALMRAEAEVLLEEAARIDSVNPTAATAEQRQGKAFGRLFRATGLAEARRYGATGSAW